jgi:hypothetical protein
MKSSWKKLITSLAIAAVLAGQVNMASAGIFSSAVRKAAGVAASSAGSSSTLRRAAGVVKSVVSNDQNNLAGRVINRAAQVVTGNDNSLAGKVLTKVVTDPNSLTARVVRRIDNIDSNSLTGKILDKARNAASDPNSLTGKILNKAKTAANDPSSLTSRVLNRAKTAVNDPNSLTAKILNKAQTAANDPNSLTAKILNKAKNADPNSITGKILARAQSAKNDPSSLTNRILDKAKVAVNDPTGAANRLVDKLKGTGTEPKIPGLQGIIAGDNKIKDKLLRDQLVDRIKKAIEANGGADIAEVAAQVAADVVNGGVDAAAGGAVDAANQNNQNDQLVGQLLNAGIQAGGQVLSSAIQARAAGGFGGGVVSSGSSFVPAEVAPEPVIVPAQEVAPTTPAPIDLELFDVRLVEAGNDEQGPLYRVMVKNLSGLDVTSEMTVALLASMDKDSNDNVSVIGSLPSLGSLTTKTVDLRLPQGSQALTYLTAVVALSDSADANETDNIATYERSTILAAK